MDRDDILLDGIFDAANAYKFVLAELLVALVESGALTREAVALIMLRTESVTSTFPDASLVRDTHAALSAQVRSRLAELPDVGARRRSRKK